MIPDKQSKLYSLNWFTQDLIFSDRWFIEGPTQSGPTVTIQTINPQHVQADICTLITCRSSRWKVCYLVYPLPWNSVLLKLLITVCCEHKERQQRKTDILFNLICVQNAHQSDEPTSMLPHVWKAVNINIKPKPRMMMLISLFPSGLILKDIWKLLDEVNIHQI